MVSAIGVLAGYERLVGGGASVDRATLMAIVYFTSRAYDQRSPPINTLGVTAACLVLLNPLIVADPAFVLTFGATFAILTLAPVGSTLSLPRFLRPAFAIFVASAATEAVLLPVGALFFSRVTFAGLGLNLLAIPLMAVAQIAGMVLVVAAVVSDRVALTIGWIAHLGAAGLVRSADLVELLPGLARRVAAPGALVVGLYYLALVSAWLFWKRANRTSRVVMIASVFAIAAWIVVEPWAILASRGDGRLHLTILDVGQGDAALVRFPHGSSLMVDTGGLVNAGAFDIGDRVVAPVLRSVGLRRLGVLALTHGDPDHIGGAGAVVREFHPKDVWEGVPVPRFEPLRVLVAEAQSAGSRWTTVHAGDQVVIDEVRLLIWHPPPPDWERQRVRNDDSIVLELRWKDVSVLFTGDVGRPVERLLGPAIPRAALRVVKVPHHGSLTSSSPEFVRALAPTVAVFSAGRANHFGHPAADVLQRYRDVGAEIFRTDQDGAVMVDTDGTSLTVHTFTGRHAVLQKRSSGHEVTKGTTDFHEDAKRTKDTKP
jgi:competence protein ComEC